MVGFDVPLGLNTLAGLGLGYAHSKLDGKTTDNRTEFDTHEAMIYVDHEAGPWFAYGDASLGLNNYSGVRHISFTGVDRTALADYNGASYTGFATTGYHFFAEGITITPFRFSTQIST